MNQKSRLLLSVADGVRLHNAAFILLVLAVMATSISYLAETYRSPWPIAFLCFGFGLGCGAACRRGMPAIPGRRRKSLLPFSTPTSPGPKRAVDLHACGIWQEIDANGDQRRLLLERMRGRPHTKLRTAIPMPRRSSMPAHAADDALEGE